MTKKIRPWTPRGRFLPLITRTGGREGEKGVLLPLQMGSLEAIEAALPDPECCIPESPGTLEDLILSSACLAGFWKLNETSGDTAADSSSGNHTLASGIHDPPTWASATAPFGENAALFGDDIGEENGSVSALTGDLTLEIWAKRTDVNGAGFMIGQGDPVSATTPGVGLVWGFSGSGNLFTVFIGDNTGGPHVITSDVGYATSAWHHVVGRRSTHVWSLFVDGVKQTATFDDGGTNYDSASGIGVGHVAGAVTNREFIGDLSYAAIYNCALTDAEIAEHYEIGNAGGGIPNGWVLTADNTADAGWSWQPGTIEVEIP